MGGTISSTVHVNEGRLGAGMGGLGIDDPPVEGNFYSKSWFIKNVLDLLNVHFRNNVQSRLICPTGPTSRRRRVGGKKQRAEQAFMNGAGRELSVRGRTAGF